MSEADLPAGRLLSWYGDDFTGSAAVMEALTFGGIPAVLFLGRPTETQLARFPTARAIGIAGVARAMTPEVMDAELPPIFSALADLGTALTHYKVCSTLDSTPEVGSIGRAVELANPDLGGAWIPTLIAAPPIGRWQAFGHLFAAAGPQAYRLDRHPVMSRHPVTAMTESDVALHLSRQTDIPSTNIDLVALATVTGADAALARSIARGKQLITLNCTDDAGLVAAGRLIWEHRRPRILVVGSQGVEYALLAYWRSIGALPDAAEVPGASPVGQIAAVSGSVSPTTAAQIDWAGGNGFGLVAFDAHEVVDQSRRLAAIDRALGAALAELAEGRSVIIYTALGPHDPAVGAFRAAVSGSCLSMPEANALLGDALGQVLARLLARTSLGRAVISGGDMSGHSSLRLGVEALTALAPTIPGAALCTAHRKDASTLQLALKGGQMGTDDCFGWIRDGGGRR